MTACDAIIEAPCWVEHMSERDYRSYPGLSSSMARRILKSPAHLISSLAEPQEQTTAMLFGVRLHQAAIFGFESLKCVGRPREYDGRKTFWKEWLAEKEKEGRLVLSWDDYRAIRGICEELSEDEDFKAAITSHRKEYTGFANLQVGPHTILAKTRLDVLPLGDTVIDIKTTASASVDDFAWSILKFGYHVQAHHYLAVANAIIEARGNEERKQHFMFFAVEKEPPFAYRKIVLSNRFLILAETEWMKGAELYAQCMENDSWPGYSKKIAVIDPPRFTSERFLSDEL